jgi:hypothetical protein
MDVGARDHQILSRRDFAIRKLSRLLRTWRTGKSEYLLLGL